MIQEWNEFIANDANVKLAYQGPADEVCAQWSWNGKKSGAGQATLIKSVPGTRVELRLDFRRPLKVSNLREYALDAAGDGTQVRWTIYETALIPRVLSNFMDLEKMIGSIFEKGLKHLKTLVEAKQ